MEAPIAPGNAREPCPDRILDDVGSAFAMGAIGGTAFHVIKGALTSPKGSRLRGGAQLTRLNAPRIGGSFAVWGGLFSTLDCTLVYLRQKEDPWNSILSGAGAGGILALRQGARRTLVAAAFGGVLLAMIEGVGVFMTNHGKRLEEAMHQAPPGLPQYETTPPTGRGEILGSFDAPMQSFPEFGQSSQTVESSKEGSSWFGGLFGGGKKTEILESFDSPSAPIRFDYK